MGYDVLASRMSQWITLGGTAFLGWCGVTFSVLLLLQEFLLPDWQPPRRFALAASFGVVLAVAAAERRRRRLVRGVAFDPDCFAFETCRGRETIPLEDL